MKRLYLAGCAALDAAMISGAPQEQTLADGAAVPAPVDPARLAEARKVIDAVMPPATRDQMFESMIGALMKNMMQGIMQNPDFQTALDRKPGARDVFNRFVERQQELGLADLRANMPGMIDAMARAYARRFTVEQLRDIAAFFETPTGKAYTAQVGQIMADPDVAAWQQSLMARSMARAPDEVAQLRREIEALDSKGKPNAP
jgi:hypothetical protein